MNEIPELKNDFAFLKKIDSRSKVWKEFDGPTAKGKEKIRSNFILHPKRLSSESETETSLSDPTPRFFSGTVLKSLNLKDSCSQNCNLKQMEKSPVEPQIGDSINFQASTTKTLIAKHSSRITQSQIDNFEKKFKTLVERSLKHLTNIRNMIEGGIPSPDGEEDYFRRMKRLQEFLARFSRVYIYPLMRQTDELSMPEKLSAVAINQKLLYAQQIILQGLQAYYSHLPSSVDKCGSDKLKSLLDQILYLCHLYEQLKKDVNSESWEFVNAMRNYVQLLSETLTTFDLKFASKKLKKPDKKCKVESKPPNKPHKTKSKLSMYVMGSFRKDLAIRKHVETKKKNIVKSRYKTAGFKHRPPVEKQAEEFKDKNRIRLFQKSSSHFSGSTQRRSPFREEDIKTMVEVESEFEAPPNTRENMNHESSVASSRLVRDSGRKNQENEDPSVEKALEVLRKFLENNSQKDVDILEKIASEVDKRKEDETKKKMKEPVVTVTGARNAKLICIRDDNSVVEDDGFQDKEVMTDVELIVKSSETQTEIKEDKRKTAIKISRLPRHNKRLLQLLPKDYAINIIQYKLRYSHFHKHNPMYRKSAHIQPCVLMGKISDEILDFIIKSVTSELEVNEILENLYNAEFQD